MIHHKKEISLKEKILSLILKVNNLIITSIENDTTILSEMEYINILPNLENMDMNDSSFLKGSFVNGQKMEPNDPE
jgi:hypothetical protein